MEIQFTPHAIERVLGRLSKVVSYGEVQSNLAGKQLMNGNQRVLVKVLPASVIVKDETAINGEVRGARVYALCTVKDGGCVINTIALSD